MNSPNQPNQHEKENQDTKCICNEQPKSSHGPFPLCLSKGRLGAGENRPDLHVWKSGLFKPPGFLKIFCPLFHVRTISRARLEIVAAPFIHTGANMNYLTSHARLGLILTLMTTNLYAETWQIGLYAENSRAPFVGEEREITPVPEFIYIGEKLSYIGGEVQYKVFSANGMDSYVIGQMRHRQFYTASLGFKDDLDIDGMEDRDSAFELGLGVNYQANWGQFVFEGLYDVTNTHKGYELSATYSYPKQMGAWLIEPAIGVQYQSSNLIGYYHGVMADEAQAGRPAYTAGQAVNVLTSLTLGYTISEHLLAVGGVEQLTLNDSITDSPIVDQDQVRKVFLGLIYTL